MKRAIIFWACRNKHYLNAAEFSARTAKRVMPDVDIVLITDKKHWHSIHFDRIIRVSTPEPEDVCFPPLLEIPEDTYDSGIYVDAEAYFCAPIYDVFKLVEGERVDIALVHTSGKIYVDQKFPSPSVPDAFPHWRSAFIAFRHHDRIRQLFARWEEEFHKYKQYGLRGGIRYPDQSALRIALYHSDLRFATLPPNYCCTGGDIVVRNTVRILAYHEDETTPEKLAREINKHAPDARLLIRGKAIKL